MTTKEVTIELPTGARWGVSSAEQAKKLYPGAKIISYADGTPYEEKPKPTRQVAQPKAARPRRTKAKQLAPDAVPDVPQDDPDMSAPAPETSDGTE